MEHLCGSSLRGTWREGSFAVGTEGYESKALGMGIRLHGGSVWPPEVGFSTWDYDR